MGIKRHKPEVIVTKLRQVEVLCGQGMPRIDAIRQVQITEQTFYRWRKQYGGKGTDQLKELRRLQKENDRLRRAVSDLTLDKLILSEAARMKAVKETFQWMARRPEREALLSPSRRPLPGRRMAKPCCREGASFAHVRSQFRVSERRACLVLGQHRSTQRSLPVGRADEERLVSDMIDWPASVVSMVTAGSQLCSETPDGL